jgi:hypothetical protein
LHPSSAIHKTVTAIGHVGGRLLLRYYDLYQRLQLQFDVLLLMGAMETRNMQSDFAVNKYLHTVASRWILLIYDSFVITECSIMHYNKSAVSFALHRFKKRKFRTQFLIKHALSTVSVHHIGLHMH